MQGENLLNMIKPGEGVADYKDNEAFKKSLMEFKIPYREKLNLPDYITIGIEIETNAVRYWTSFKSRKIFLPWKVKYDSSVPKGAEFISPILRDDEKSWKGLKNICTFLKEKSTEFDMDPGGGHIHIGAQVFRNGFETIMKFIKFWSVFEDIIIEFGRGEYTMGRPGENKYAGSSRKRIDYVVDFCSQYHVGMNILGYISRKYALNFSNLKTCEMGKKNTVEFRSPNGTIEAVIWQNNVNFFAHLVDFSNSEKFDEKLINEMYFNKDYAQGFEGACVLADMIFEDNFDKICFLRQFVKSENDPGEFGRRECFFENCAEELQIEAGA